MLEARVGTQLVLRGWQSQSFCATQPLVRCRTIGDVGSWWGSVVAFNTFSALIIHLLSVFNSHPLRFAKHLHALRNPQVIQQRHISSLNIGGLILSLAPISVSYWSGPVPLKYSMTPAYYQRRRDESSRPPTPCVEIYGSEETQNHTLHRPTSRLQT